MIEIQQIGVARPRVVLLGHIQLRVAAERCKGSHSSLRRVLLIITCRRRNACTQRNEMFRRIRIRLCMCPILHYWTILNDLPYPQMKPQPTSLTDYICSNKRGALLIRCGTRTVTQKLE